MDKFLNRLKKVDGRQELADTTDCQWITTLQRRQLAYLKHTKYIFNISRTDETKVSRTRMSTMSNEEIITSCSLRSNYITD